MAKSWKKLKATNIFSGFIARQNPNRSVEDRDLFSSNSLFVGKLYYTGKSEVPHACDPKHTMLGSCDNTDVNQNRRTFRSSISATDQMLFDDD